MPFPAPPPSGVVSSGLRTIFDAATPSILLDESMTPLALPPGATIERLRVLPAMPMDQWSFSAELTELGVGQLPGSFHIFNESQEMVKRAGVRETAMVEVGSPEQRTVYHPDFFDPPLIGGKGAEPRQKPGVIRGGAPVVTIVRDLTPNAPSIVRFARVKSDTDTEKVPVTQATSRGEFMIVIDGMQLTVKSIPDRRRITVSPIRRAPIYIPPSRQTRAVSPRPYTLRR
jgi:hypothetical protein